MTIIKKYAKLSHPEGITPSVMLGDPTDQEIQAQAESWGYTLMEVEEGWNGIYYLAGHVPPEPSITYTELRQQAYPQLTEQLDMLYHDIDQGKLGIIAKDSSFYLVLKQVKETYPKEVKDAEETEEIKEPIGVNHAND